MDLILTGASRGIGRALALALPADVRLHALARDRAALDDLARKRPGTVVHVVDLASRADAARVGRALDVEPGAVLVHDAGLWPSRREIVDGVERAFAVNCLGPLALQEPLLAAKKLARVLVVGAGLMIKGRFDARRTPVGDDFSWMRTYASTKLAFAVAMRDVARDHPDVDVAVVHPGVVRTDLGNRGGPLGWLVRLAKRSWESPETCAARLARILARPRWSAPGDARWFVLEDEQPWPAIVSASASAVREALSRSAPR